MKRYILSLSFVFFAFSLFVQSQCFSESNLKEQEYFKSSFNKIYIQPDQIIVSNDGIYVNLEGNSCPIAIDNLFCDVDGLFTVEAWHDKDPNCGHGLYCRSCGGCSPSNRCQYRCKCREKQ